MMFNPQIILIALIAMLASTGLGFYSGQNWANTKHEAQRASDLDAYNRQLNLQMSVAHDLSDRLAKAEGRITTKTIEVIKNVPIYVPYDACPIDGSFRLLHDASVHQRAVPDAANFVNAAPVAVDAAAATVVANYGTCHENAARLTALQDWVTQQGAVQ